MTCNSRKKAKDPGPWVMVGFAAFPDQWLDLWILSVEHNCDQWLPRHCDETAALHKQNGGRTSDHGGRLLDGQVHDGYPAGATS
jgi:protein gp37